MNVTLVDIWFISVDIIHNTGNNLIENEQTYIKVTQSCPVGIVKLVVIFLDKALPNLLPYFLFASHL